MDLPDYNAAMPGRKRTAYSVGKGLFLALAADILFYRKWWMFPVLLVPAAFYVRYDIKAAREERRMRLRNDFREALTSVAVSLRAGYSVENAIPEAARELASSAGQSDCAREFAYMAAQMRLSVPPEKLLSGFARRSHVPEIEDFAAVFEAARRSGGNLAAIMRDTASKIAARIDTEREIETSLAAKRYEQRIMSLMPAGIILYVSLTSPGYFDVLYSTAFGMLVMTACLTVYALGVCWGARVADVRV